MHSMQQVYDGVSSVYEVEYRIRKKDGEYVWFYDRGTVIQHTAEGGPLIVAGLVFDVTERKMKETEAFRKLEKDAIYDAMTGLKNRSSIMRELERWSGSDADTEDDMSVIFIDLDHFKHINDTYGHLFGDRVIGTVGQSIGQLARGDDEVGRYGGEEFLLILPHTDLAESHRIAETVRGNIESLMLEDGVRITISCGVATRRIGEDALSVLKRADENLYRAKDRGRNCVVSE